MRWIETKKIRPPEGELIWVWDMEKNCKFLVRYHGSYDSWIERKDFTPFPIWAHLNPEEE